MKKSNLLIISILSLIFATVLSIVNYANTSVIFFIGSIIGNLLVTFLIPLLLGFAVKLIAKSIGNKNIKIDALVWTIWILIVLSVGFGTIMQKL